MENGILLAYYLNRTLILPKALLGEAFGWNKFSKLHLHHLRRDTNNNYCRRFKNNKKARRLASCPDPAKYTLASFDDLFDLSWAKQHVKIIEREESGFDWLQRNFGIQTSQKELESGTYRDGDILFYKGIPRKETTKESFNSLLLDETRYDWRIYDIPVKNPFLGRYVDSLVASTQLKNETARLIHFTSLFGTGKFPIKDPQNQLFFKQLQKSITYKHPAVLKTSDLVVEALGGPGNFIGAHLRTADGHFVEALPENVNHLIQSINTTASTGHYSLKKCVALAKKNQVQLVFLATDAVRPRKNEQLRDLWTYAPCTFTLNDILKPNNSTSWSYMDQYRTQHTGESMRKFLVPLVDALVASKGNKFIGTKGSTFSGYIRRLHDAYWSPL